MEVNFEIDSSSGVISISSGRGVLDYETKPSYSIDVTVSDGLNSSTETLTISVQNILEDFIDYSYSISDGTLSSAPVLTARTIDELSKVKKVYARLENFVNAYNSERTNSLSKLQRYS